MFFLFIVLFIFINRVLLNENYQHIFDVGYFYYLFCNDFELKLFTKTFDNFIDKDIKILDFGCGPGIMSQFFTNYTGIDIDKTRIDYAKKIYVQKTFILVNENDKKLPFEDNSFEAILFNDCLHHISNFHISKFLPELHRILKKDGIIIIREPKKDTNFITYFITELCENGDYVRTRNEYKEIFKSFDIKYENNVNEIIRDYYILIVKNNSSQKTLFNDESIQVNIDRILMNIFTFTLFAISLYQIIIY
jgi:ubiquinone/menaquinone biosynthesis C-methylase UbiE